MKLKELIRDLEQKESYKEFKKQNPEAFFCSAMFILGDADKIDLNFFIPNQKKISSFAMPYGKITNHQEEAKNQEEIKNIDLKIDASDLMNFIKEKTGKDYKKLIAVLSKGIWNVTCLNGLDMCRFNIDVNTGEVDEKDKCSLTDMIKIKKEED